MGSAVFKEGNFSEGLKFHRAAIKSWAYGDRTSWFNLALAISMEPNEPRNHALHAVDVALIFDMGAWDSCKLLAKRAEILIDLELFEEAIWSVDTALRLASKKHPAFTQEAHPF